MPMRIQVADPNDPRLALSLALDQAREALDEVQQGCGCADGATCALCAHAAAVHTWLVTEYQALYAPVILTAENVPWWRLPIAEWAWKGDAAQKED